MLRRLITRVLAAVAILVVVLGAVLFVPPIRDRFFVMNLWPWHINGEVTSADIRAVEAVSKPGDVIIETNWHYWQWVTLCRICTGSTWVHASLVDERGRLLTVAGSVKNLPMDIYLQWRSTRLAVIRPPYANHEAAQKAISHARSKLGHAYDPSFNDQDGNCTGLVADSLHAAGIEVPSITKLGHRIFPASAFFRIRNAQVVWTSGTKQ